MSVADSGEGGQTRPPLVSRARGRRASWGALGRWAAVEPGHGWLLAGAGQAAPSRTESNPNSGCESDSPLSEISRRTNIPTPPPIVTADSSNALSPQTRHPASQLCMSSTHRESKPLFPPPHSVNAARSRMSQHRTTSEDGRRTEAIDCPASDHNMNDIDGVPLGNVYPASYSAVAQGVSFHPVGISRECSTFTCSHPCGG